MDQPPEFARFDTIPNAVDSIKTSASFLSRQDEFKWKWVAIALHHALYMFCVAALHNGNPDNVTTISPNPDHNQWWRIGDDQKWKRSKKVKVDSGPAYRIEWLPTEDLPPQKKCKKVRINNRSLLVFGQLWRAFKTNITG